MKLKDAVLNLLALLIALTVLFFTLELMFRLPAVKERTGGNDPILNQWVNSVHANHEINSWGFRDTEHQLDNPEKKFRILILGDSVAYGQMVNKELIFPRLLENNLNQSSSHQLEVINISLMGWNTVEQLQGLKEFGIKFNPDLIIIAFHLNDLQVKQNPVGKEVFDRERPIIPIASIDTYLNHHSYFYSFFRFRYNRLLEKYGKKTNYVTWQRYPYQSNSRGFIAFKQALTEIKNISDQNQADIVWASLNFEPEWEKEISLVSSTAQSLSIPVIDMFPFFQQFNAADLRISPSDWHPNKTAHQIYAQALADYIITHNLIYQADHKF